MKLKAINLLTYGFMGFILGGSMAKSVRIHGTLQIQDYVFFAIGLGLSIYHFYQLTKNNRTCSVDS